MYKQSRVSAVTHSPPARLDSERPVFVEGLSEFADNTVLFLCRSIIATVRPQTLLSHCVEVLVERRV